MVTVTRVEQGSLAERNGVLAGDILLSINGHPIRDVIDYRFYLAETRVELSLHRGAELYSVTLQKGEYDDVGLEFETPLMDKKHCCANRCVFCFVDQLPPGMRESRYFKDDDDRLSFLRGNYVTLTNLSDADVERLITMHISPINVSVHTTNPALRCEMMKNPRAGEVLSYLKRLSDAGIRLCCQIVLCRGVNDGAELLRSMQDLAALSPAVSSVSVVPAGLTRYREGLYPLTPFTREECREVIAAVNAFGDKLLEKTGNRIFCVADEFYLKAELPLPPESYYGDYEQIENGVGLLRSLMAEFADELDYLSDYIDEKKPLNRHVSLATGKAAAPTLRLLGDMLMARVTGLEITVYEIENEFFGPEITVAGLLTGRDMANQLRDKPLGAELLIPATTLRAEGDLFLCGMTPAELSATLGVPVTPTAGEGAALLAAMLGKER